jgi:hypothetical protein
MALSDPLVLALGGEANLPRTSVDGSVSKYSALNDDYGIVATVSHTEGKRTRRLFRVDLSKVTADPFIPDINREVSGSMYLVLDVPRVGFTDAELQDTWEALYGCLNASSFANFVKWIGGQS